MSIQQQQVKQSKPSYPQKSDQNTPLGSSQTTLWLGGLETWEDENYLYLIFQQILPAYCVVTNITIVRDAVTEASLGYGFVDFGSHQAAETALQICRKTMRPGHTRPFRISWAASNTFSHKRAASTMLATPTPMPPTYPVIQPTVRPPAAPVIPADENMTLYVTPLEKHITKFILAEEIKKFGYNSIISIKIAHNANGISRGFGFIRFGNRDECKDALERLKTLRLGENQQPLHVTLARCNSYDPEYTVSNETLFGNNPQNNRRGNNSNPGNSKRRRLPYGSPSSHANSGPLLDINGAQGNQMMMPKMHATAGYSQMSMLGPMGMPPSSTGHQYVMPPMMGIPTPPASTSPYPMSSMPSSTYQPAPTSGMPMGMPPMLQQGGENMAMNPNLGMNSNMNSVTAPPVLLPQSTMMVSMPANSGYNLSAPPAPSDSGIPPHPPTGTSATNVSAASIYANMPNMGELNYLSMNSASGPAVSTLPTAMSSMPVGGYSSTSTSLPPSSLQSNLSSSTIAKSVYSTNLRPSINMPQNLHTNTKTTLLPYISAAPVTISTRNNNESCDNSISTPLSAATISSPPNLTSKKSLIQTNNTTSYSVGMSCRVTPLSTSEINAYSGA